MTRSLVLLFAMLPLALSGCAKFSADGGMDEVARGVAHEAGPAAGRSVVKIATAEQSRQARDRIAALLAQPLSADAAVQVALLGNRDLQAAYNDLGLSEAAYVQASLPPNPGISLMGVAGTGVGNVELRLIEDILGLLTLPRRTAIAAEHFEHARHQAIETTLRLAADTRRAYIRTVAATQQVDFLDRARATVDASVRLNAALEATGGGDQLDQAELAAFYAELSVKLAQSRLASRRARETLTRLMGLWGADVAFATPAELPPLPPAPATIADIEVEAIGRRVDITMARHDVAALAKSLGLAEATRYVSLLELSGIANNETANPNTNNNTDIVRGGGAIDLRLPIFDTGEARTRAAREAYAQAINRLAARAVNARSEARIAYDTYRGTYDIAKFYGDRVLPLRATVSKEIALRYANGGPGAQNLQVDLFKFLTDARQRIDADSAALDARRDFLLADVDLEAALTIGGAGGSEGGGASNSIPPVSSMP